MEPISPFLAIAGGLLIGVAAALLLLLNGRVAGVSGLAATATRISSASTPWPQAVAFIVGLPMGAALVALMAGSPQIIVAAPTPLLVAAGLLVGFGARLGNGCTSGHGVCGVARLSPRSLAATATFMASGVFAVFVVRHLMGG
jgi:uncharacterized membrane protein YedE/YeeE